MTTASNLHPESLIIPPEGAIVNLIMDKASGEWMHDDHNSSPSFINWVSDEPNGFSSRKSRGQDFVVMELETGLWYPERPISVHHFLDVRKRKSQSRY